MKMMKICSIFFTMGCVLFMGGCDGNNYDDNQTITIDLDSIKISEKASKYAYEYNRINDINSAFEMKENISYCDELAENEIYDIFDFTKVFEENFKDFTFIKEGKELDIEKIEIEIFFFDPIIEHTFVMHPLDENSTMAYALPYPPYSHISNCKNSRSDNMVSNYDKFIYICDAISNELKRNNK